MTGQLDGKVVIVTGGGSGIGRASALAFAGEGAKVVVADVNVEDGEETVQMIKESDALFIKTDVSKPSEVEGMVSKAIKTCGRLDLAHNNAGIVGDMSPMHECSEDIWDRVMSVNLKGVWLCMKHEISHMLKHGGGAIVNTASVGGLVGSANVGAAYVASKHGVVGLTRTAALAYAQQGIRVNAVCPGIIRTPMVTGARGIGPEVEEQLTARYPIRRIGMPEEVATAVVWLCSDASSFITGHALAVDGGFVAQ